MRWLKELRAMAKGKSTTAFTIIELVVVIAIVAILATVVILSYNGWRTSVVTNQVKSDLSQAASAMQTAVAFSNTYPSDIPDTFKSSADVDVELIEHTDTTFCIEGTSGQINSIIYNVDQNYGSGSDPSSGTCANRPASTPPEVPTSVAAAGVSATTVSLSWTAPSGIVSGYVAQCAQDSGFVLQLKQATPTGTSATITGVDATTTVFCRVKAQNSAGDSSWSPVVMIDSDQYYPPGSIVASNRTNSSFTISWASNPDAETYSVQCAQNSGYSTGLKSATIASPSVSSNFTSLLVNTTYYCRVKTVGANGSSGWSSNLVTSTGNDYGSLAVGSSIQGYWSSVPTGFLEENGSAVSRTTYADLFAVIGTTYGSGDGSTTFNLPDSRGRVSVNLNSSDTEFDSMGEKYGTKTELLTIAQMPSHTHIQNTHTHGAGGRTEASGGGTASGFGGTISALRSGTNNYTLDNQYVSVGATTAINQNTGADGAHNNIQPSITRRFAIKFTGIDPAAATLPAGSSINGYWSSPPSGYLLENGSAVSRTTYADLFAVIGTTYGSGDGSTTFNLPDSRGRVSVNLNSSDTEFDSMGEKYGEKQHTLTLSELPAHTHVQNAHSHTATSRTEAGTAGQASGWAGVASGIRSNTNNYTQEDQIMNFSSIVAVNQNTGGGGSDNTIQPSIVRLSAIKFTPATGSSSPVAVGTSVESYSSSVPSGYLYENGSAVSRTTYSDLFAAIGTTYGSGDGSTTFNLPDSRGRTGVCFSTGDTEFDTIGEKYGEKAHLLTIAEMPSHTHIQNSHTHTAAGRTEATGGGTASGFGGAQSAVRANVNNYTLDSSYVAVGNTAAVNQSTGGGQAFNVIQPSIVKRFNIKY